MTETAGKKVQPNDRLRNERIRRGWSQQDLADKVGTTPLNVGRWERGITIPGPYLRQKLCEVYEKSPPELGLVPERVEMVQATAVEGNPSAVAPSPQAPTTLWNVPYGRNLLFTGREDILAHLRDTLLNEEHPVALAQPQAISGLGGIGKTQTAIEYAHRYRESYEAVFWARADSADLLTSDFLLMAALLNLPQRNEQDQNVVVKAVLRWFDTHERWLLILDNADQLEMVSEFMPSAGKGHVLLTTRANSTGTIAQRIEIEKMGRDEGMVLLLRRMKRLKGDAALESLPEAVRSQAQAIVEAVDGLPLALDQAGAYIEETGCTLSDYLKFYKTRHSRLLRMRGASATGHPEPVATTWSLSFEKVERANPAAAELLKLCAFLHPDEIPEAMIIEGASELGPILQPVAEDELDWNEAIGELRKYSLVKRDPDEKILNIHRLVQAVIRDGMDKEMQREWAERIVRMVSKAFPEVDFGTWGKCQQYLPQARVCAELIGHYQLFFAEGANLLTRAGTYLRERVQYIEAEHLYQQGLAIRQKVQEETHPDIAESLNALGLLYWYRGQFDQSAAFLQQALSIREQAYGPEHPLVAETLNDLAEAYNSHGKYDKAESLHLRVLAIREKAYGPDHPHTATSLNNLAVLYTHQGRHTEAVPLQMRDLAISEKVFGLEHPETATSMANLANLYYNLGKHHEAEELSQRALTIFEKIYGPDHPLVAMTLDRLGVLNHALGKYEQAELFFYRALHILEQSLGPDHPDVAVCLGFLAKLYHAQKKYDEAELLQQRALAIREKALGPNHLFVARTLTSLAIVYRDLDKYDKAELLFKRAISIIEENQQLKHPDLANTLENYADLLRKTKRDDETLTLEQRIQAIRAKQE